MVQALFWLREERQQAVFGIKQGLSDAAVGRMQPLFEAFASIRKEFGVPDTDFRIALSSLKKAKDDLRHHSSVTAQHAPETATRWLCRCEESLQTLSDNATRRPLAPEGDLVDQPICQFFKCGDRSHYLSTYFFRIFLTHSTAFEIA